MKTIKVVVKVNRSGARVPEYLQRADPTPIHMTTNRKLALVWEDSRPKMLSNPSKTPGAAWSWSR
jgi:hypothetical protein